MSDAPKLYTERDLVLAKRAGFVEGLTDAKMHSATAALWSYPAMDRRARRKFPLPKVTRPRVLTDSSGERWTVRAGQIALYTCDLSPRVRPSADRVKLWADLLANPTETVEADE